MNDLSDVCKCEHTKGHHSAGGDSRCMCHGCNCTMFSDYQPSEFVQALFEYAEYCERLPFQVHLARVKACIGPDGKIDLSKLKREG